MKAFFISTLIFSVMLALVLFNSFYVVGTTDQIMEMLSSITSEPENLMEEVSELESFWDKNSEWLDLTANRQFINSIGTKIANIRLYAERGESKQLGTIALILNEEVKELRRLEKFSFGNIF